jgi:hypothetical protein
MIVSIFLTTVTLILLLNPIDAIAQEPITPPNWHDSTATEALLAVLANRAEQTHNLQGQFQQQKQLQGLPLPLKASGNYSYSQHQGLNWHTLSPINSTLQIGNKPGRNTGTLGSNTNANLVANIFIAVVRGDLKQLQQYFNIQSSGDIAQWHLRLTPIKQALANYLNYIDVTGAELTEQLYVAEASGDITSIKLKNSVSSTQADEAKGKGIVKGEQ